MQLLRSLWFFVAYCDAELACFHITGQPIQLLTICHAMTCHAFFPSHHTATTITSANSSRQPRLDLHTLQKALQSYYHQGLAASTHKTYAASVQHNLSFCEHTFITHPFQLLSKHFCCL